MGAMYNLYLYIHCIVHDFVCNKTVDSCFFQILIVVLEIGMLTGSQMPRRQKLLFDCGR
jgi:hypothetical protein